MSSGIRVAWSEGWRVAKVLRRYDAATVVTAHVPPFDSIRQEGRRP